MGCLVAEDDKWFTYLSGAWYSKSLQKVGKRNLVLDNFYILFTVNCPTSHIITYSPINYVISALFWCRLHQVIIFDCHVECFFYLNFNRFFAIQFQNDNFPTLQFGEIDLIFPTFDGKFYISKSVIDFLKLVQNSYIRSLQYRFVCNNQYISTFLTIILFSSITGNFLSVNKSHSEGLLNPRSIQFVKHLHFTWCLIIVSSHPRVLNDDVIEEISCQL